jgi:dolichol-phosphate mannosyltransferase
MIPVLHVIIPIYNESENIPKLSEDAFRLYRTIERDFDARFLFIDDGSTDDTRSRIESFFKPLPCAVIRHKANFGPGRAFASAFAYLEKQVRDIDWIVTMEGDNTSRMEVLLQMLKRREEGYDAVLASPYQYGGGFSRVSGIRIVISHIANGMVKMILGLRGFHTFSSFFRLISGRAFKRLQTVYGKTIIESSGFECMVEWLMKMVDLHFRISEVEMRLDWSARKGKSKMKIWKTITGYLRLFLSRQKIIVFKND